MWTPGWRDEVWSRLGEPWDLIIVGGGITGAGILREAARAGLHPLLVEKGDFASGTSSRSSKMVHGGFRYLRNAHWRLTRESVRERRRLLRQAPGLITPMDFLLANYRRDRVPGWLFGMGLAVYDILGWQWDHQHLSAESLQARAPELRSPELKGGFRYLDAKVDDARLVLRLIQEAVRAGATALHFAEAQSLLRLHSGEVTGVLLRDRVGHRSAEVHAPVVVNAAGVWSDQLRSQLGKPPRLRKLRGGHLLFPWQRVPLTAAVSFLHPRDARPVFIFPWEGVTLYGTTDVDHRWPVDSEVVVSSAEAEYLMEGLRMAFPTLELGPADVQATFAGVRSVLDTGMADPSREPRRHVLWQEEGLLTVTGGKLTTFRLMAQQALRMLRGRLRGIYPRKGSVLEPLPAPAEWAADLDPGVALRLAGRYGQEAAQLVARARPGELVAIGETPALWAELRWAAYAEGVVHLDDLLLRRVRLGLTLPQGAIACLPRIRAIAQPELGWDDSRWEAEAAAYASLWSRTFAPPR